MKKVLYLTNIEVPYRVKFFNELAKYCELTVLYERQKSANRNEQWAKSEQQNYQSKYLNGIRIANENTFSLGIVRELFRKYDSIIVGCYNSPVQMFAILVMRILRIPYLLNLDGEPFLTGKSIKILLKRFFLFGAQKYLVAGDRAAESLKKWISNKEIIPYYFSSLNKMEIEHNAEIQRKRNGKVLVIGQYFDYKGMDVALEAARMDKDHGYRFVGMGLRTQQFQMEQKIPINVELIPFLQRQELEREYQQAEMVVLPSRKECWGLVINEAASFGVPIVATWGSGAAIEFLSKNYAQYLARPGDAADLHARIDLLRNSSEQHTYSQYLRNKSRYYTIEQGVEAHLAALGISV